MRRYDLSLLGEKPQLSCDCCNCNESLNCGNWPNQHNFSSMQRRDRAGGRHCQFVLARGNEKEAKKWCGKDFWECNLEGVSWKGTKSVQGKVDDPEIGKTGELAELQTLNLVGVEVDHLDVGQAELLHVGDLVVVQPEDMQVGEVLKYKYKYKYK